MNILRVRQISQVFFLFLFLWFCIASSLGEQWWQLRGWPVNWLLQLDPLIALGTMLTTRALYAGLLWAMVTVVLTILLGRFFCGWVCPFGSLHHFLGYLGKRRKSLRERVAVNQYRRGQSIKYYLLIFLLTGAAGSSIAHLMGVSQDRPVISSIAVIAGVTIIGVLATLKLISNLGKAVVILLILVGVWAGLSFFLPLDRIRTASLQIGLLDPIALVYRSVNLVVLPMVDSGVHKLSTVQRYYEGAWLIGAILLTALFLNLRIPRFYCRFICPYGVILRQLSRISKWRVTITPDECIQCRLCEESCPFGAVRKPTVQWPKEEYSRSKERLALLLVFLIDFISAYKELCSI